MRTLIAALLAEQKKTTRTPYLKVVAADYIGAVARLHWETLHTDGTADAPHAAAVPTDGSLNRLRVQSNVLCHQRVTTPGPTSDFTSWSSFRVQTARAALARYGANLLAFAVDSATPTQIYINTSADSGATWGGWSLLTTAAGTVTHIAAAAETDGANVGQVLVVFAVGATVYRIKRTAAGVWGAIAAWTNTAASVTGLAVATFWSTDFNIVITGTETGTTNPRVWGCLYGGGYSETLDAWSALHTITPADAGSNVAYSVPALAHADTTRAAYREAFTGAVAYDRMATLAGPADPDFVDNLWTNPQPFDLAHNYGLALAFDAASNYLFATTPSRVYRAATAPASVDLTADVLACTAHDYPFDPRGATIRVRNDDGRYNSPGAGALLALSRGARIDIGVGYRLPGQALGYAHSYSYGPPYHIDSLEHVATPTRRELVINCISSWGNLARWKPGRTHHWPAGARNYFQIICEITAKVGLTFGSLSYTSKITNDYPDFAIHPAYDPPPYISGWTTITRPGGGSRWHRTHPVTIRIPIWTDPPPLPADLDLPSWSSGLAAIAQLYSHLEDRCFIRGGPTNQKVYNVHPQAADASVYALGTTHAILAGAYQHHAVDNRFLAVGAAGLTAETIDYTGSDLLADRPRVVEDKNMTTAADVTGRATREARDATITSRSDSLVIPPHCGLELFDVLDITHPAVGLAAAKRRVIGITLVYDLAADKPVYHQLVTLGEP